MKLINALLIAAVLLVGLTSCDFGGEENPTETTELSEEMTTVETIEVPETEVYVSVMGCFPVLKSDMDLGIYPSWTGTVTYHVPSPGQSGTKVVSVTGLPVNMHGCFVSPYVKLEDLEIGFWIYTSDYYEGLDDYRIPSLAELRIVTFTSGAEDYELETKEVNYGDLEENGFPIWDANTYVQ